MKRLQIKSEIQMISTWLLLWQKYHWAVIWVMQLGIRFLFKHFNISEIRKTGGGVMMEVI